METHEPVPTDGSGDHTPRERAEALASLLAEEGKYSEDIRRDLVEYARESLGPENGARVVARAWKDPSFRRRLLEDATPVIEEMGLQGIEGVDLVFVENTPTVHNVLVCTQCSCFPWPLAGLPPDWYKAVPYRSRIVKQPRQTLREEFGLELDPDTEIRVWDVSAEIRYVVLPQPPADPGGESSEKLAQRVTQRHLIGVDRMSRNVPHK